MKEIEKHLEWLQESVTEKNKKEARKIWGLNAFLAFLILGLAAYVINIQKRVDIQMSKSKKDSRTLDGEIDRWNQFRRRYQSMEKSWKKSLQAQQKSIQALSQRLDKWESKMEKFESDWEGAKRDIGALEKSFEGLEALHGRDFKALNQLVKKEREGTRENSQTIESLKKIVSSLQKRLEEQRDIKDSLKKIKSHLSRFEKELEKKFPEKIEGKKNE